MRQVGFRNFRKFSNLETIDFAPITIFVGENNAGKSTVVKAILSMLDFINGRYLEMVHAEDKDSVLKQYFYFNKSYFAHIGTFKRALYNKAETGIIVFCLTLDFAKFDIEVEGDVNDEEAINARINKLKINLITWNIDLIFDFLEDDLMVFFHDSPSELFDNSIFPNSAKGTKTKKYYESVPQDACLHFRITGKQRMLGGPFVDWLLYMFCTSLDTLIDNLQKKNADNTESLRGCFELKSDISEESKNFLIKNRNILERYNLIGYPFMYTGGHENVEYIYAHAVTQTVIYSAKDTNDYFVKTIHEFANCRIEQNSSIYTFIIKWMKEFNIGTGYEIKSVGGEAHIVKIFAKDGTCVNLADKGMGSIQLMILLFRLATKLYEQKSYNRRRGLIHNTIIIEEPEQNLHPKLQSKLAELFYEMNKDYNFMFLIETHSEYLIRKSQLIVKKIFNNKRSKKNTNPFKLYYFPSKGNPYEMKYKENGVFLNDFGTGFFDEAAKLTLDLL